MPEVVVLTKRPANVNGLTIILSNGDTWRMPVSPSTWNYKDVQRWGQIEREGHKTISRTRGGGLRSLDFSILVASLDTRVDVETAIARLTAIGARGEVFRIKGGSPTYQGPCWWFMKDYGLSAKRLTPQGLITQGALDFQLEEYVNPTLSVIKPPPPPPVKPRATAPQVTPVRAPVYRYHTVVCGDWLSKLALRYLGRCERWPEIYKLNRTIIGHHPNRLRPGMRLRIPPK